MSEGTCVRLVELGGRGDGVPLGLGFAAVGPRREGGEADHGLRAEALPVPGREDWTDWRFVEVRWAGVAWEAPSSEAMSVIREEIMEGGPAGGGGS